MKRMTPKLAVVSAILILVTLGMQFVILGRANPNPFGPPQIISDAGSPDSETKPPEISIRSPTNATVYSSTSISLNFNASVGDSDTASVRFVWEVTIGADWLPNNITAYKFNADQNPYTTERTIIQFYKTLNLTGIPEGKHRLTVYARERGAYERYDYFNEYVTKIYVTNFFIDGSSSVVFTVDLTPPTILALSVENKTYYSSEVPLRVTTDEPSQIIYILDDQERVTMSGNSTLAKLSIGMHNLTVFAADTVGHVGASDTIVFTVAEPESFPVLPAVAVGSASVSALAAGLLLLHRKKSRKEKAQT